MGKPVVDIQRFTGLEVPKTVAVCPDCGGQLWVVEIDEWSHQDDGTLVPEHWMLECEHEPELEDAGWEDFVRSHYQMPYVDWLPLEGPVKAWMVATFAFEEGESWTRKLERWVASVRGVDANGR